MFDPEEAVGMSLHPRIDSVVVADAPLYGAIRQLGRRL